MSTRRDPLELAYLELKNRLSEIHDLRKAAQLLIWDQETMMPPKGAAVRAEQLATLSRIAHERFTDAEIGRLLEDLRPYEERLSAESDAASLIRVTRRDYEKATRVPPDLAAEITRAASVGREAWVEARQRCDYGHFLPHLQTNLELKRRYVECFDVDGEAYDVLLDDYEPEAKTAEVRAVFDRLKAELVPLIARIVEAEPPDDSFLQGRFSIDAQRAFALSVIERFGYRADSWRLDPTVHPFATNSATTDIRLTTRYTEDELTSLFSAMHECGHGLYEHGVSPSLERTPLCRGASLGLHESQSRMWENIVGRSRPFWQYAYPGLREAFPEQLGAVDAESFYRAINKAQPSLIRVDADEATYNLHIVLRFELEQELLAGDVPLRDLPEAWNVRMKEYLGIDVPDDSKGVLQDIHWSSGRVGYFPTYSLGNVMSVQIWEAALRAIPDLPEQFVQGEFGALGGWLRENLYRHGRKFTPAETLARVTGGPIDPGPYLRYLHEKYGQLYDLEPPSARSDVRAESLL